MNKCWHQERVWRDHLITSFISALLASASYNEKLGKLKISHLLDPGGKKCKDKASELGFSPVPKLLINLELTPVSRNLRNLNRVIVFAHKTSITKSHDNMQCIHTKGSMLSKKIIFLFL